MDIRAAVYKILTANILGSLFSFGGLVVFANKLGAAQMGVFFLFQSVIGLLGIPVDFGITSAVEKRISEGQKAPEVLSTGILIKLVVLLPVSAGLFVSDGLIYKYVGSDITSILILGLIAQQFGQFGLRTLNGEMRVGDTAIIRITQKAIWILIGLGLIEFGYDVRAIMYSFVLGWIVAIVWTSYRLSTPVGFPSWPMTKSLLTYGRYALIGSVGDYLYSWMDVAILGFFVGNSAIGAYEFAWRVAAFVMLFQSAVRTVIFPQISEWNAKGDTSRIEDLLERALILPLLIAVPALFGGLVLGRDILVIVFGTSLSAGATVLIIFLIEKIFRSVHLTLSPTLFAMNKPELGYRGSGGAIVANLMLNFALIPQFGVVGAAVATSLSSIIGAVISIMYLRRLISIRFPTRIIGWALFSSVLMSIAVFVLREGVKTNTFLSLGLAIAAGVCIYGLCTVAYAPIRIELQEIVQALS